MVPVALRMKTDNQFYNLSVEDNLSSLDSNPSVKTVERPRGQRPKTVGQSDDSPRVKRLPPPPAAARRQLPNLQDRMEDLRVSLELAGITSTDELASTDPSPRVLPAMTREQYLQESSDAYFQSVSDHDLTGGTLTDQDSVVGSVPQSPSTARTADRATSPSMASVTSGHSAASSVGGVVRRNLEWDSGADLGYLGDSLPQKEAAASLSTLEKLAIGNYSNYFRGDPEGKPAKDRLQQPPFNPPLRRRQLPTGPELESELRQARLNKFADSLIRQRQLRQMAMVNQSANEQASKLHQVQQRRRRRSKSAENGEKSKSQNATPESSPSRRRRKRYTKHKSPLKSSSSLTDLQSLPSRYRRKSSTSSGSAWLPKTPFDLSNQPSSCSSTGTVVPILIDDNLEEALLQQISTDPASLPPELHDMLKKSSPDESKASEVQNSLTSLSSKPSGSRSYETVIDVEKKRAPRVMDSDSFDTEDEIQFVKRASAYFNRNTGEGRESETPSNAWTSSNERQPISERAKSLPIDAAAKDKVSKGSQTSKRTLTRRRQELSSAATTSEDEKLQKRQPTNSSTLESAPIDRAKSFEYFPGEVFPLQENSSSYEYLPGHLVNDNRPGTVVSNRRDDDIDAAAALSSTHGNEGSTTSSDSSSFERNKRFSHELAEKNLNLATDLNLISNELMNRYKDLHEAHVLQMKDFYKKLKKHIEFISVPSKTPDDCRTKQAIADRLLNVLKDEEFKLAHDRPLASRLGRDLVSLKKPLSPAPPPSAPLESENDSKKKSSSEKSNASPGFPSLQNWMTSPENASVDLEIQRLRIEQMKKLRKEIRKLEKLECIRLNKAMGVNDNQDLLRQVTEDLQSSFDSLATDITDVFGSELPPVKSREKKIEGASNSDGNGASTYQKNAPSRPRSSSRSTATYTKSTKPIKDFSQNYPTPRPATASSSNKDGCQHGKPAVPRPHRSNKGQQTEKPRRKSLAYYLPVEKPHLIQIGQRKLRQKADDMLMEKENRDILANYVSSINNAPVKRKPPAAPSTPPTPSSRCTLQQALAECRPGFIQRSKLRVELLRDIQAERLAYSEAQKTWLEKQTTKKTANEKNQQLPANLQQPKVRRLFNYRQMVAETRRKYQQLPEVLTAKQNAKRRSRDRTNRLMAQIYKRQLKDNVLKGRVSHLNGANVIKY